MEVPAPCHPPGCAQETMMRPSNMWDMFHTSTRCQGTKITQTDRHISIHEYRLHMLDQTHAQMDEHRNSQIPSGQLRRFQFQLETTPQSTLCTAEVKTGSQPRKHAHACAHEHIMTCRALMSFRMVTVRGAAGDKTLLPSAASAASNCQTRGVSASLRASYACA